MTVKTDSYIRTRPSHQDISASNAITGMAQGSMFWRPIFLQESEWLEHVPFAFWLIDAHKPSIVVELDTHSGVSYFAMCQAVDRLQLETNCYAVGAWKDESFSGHPDSSDSYEQIKRHNDTHYSSFSRLIAAHNQEALEHFPDRSIDLIHFNDLQGYEAGRQLINAWLPKISDRGLLIINKTNLRDKDHYVHRLFEELKETNPTFEFRHGDGLGLLGLGKNQSALVKALFEDTHIHSNKQVVRDVFSRLGHACADSFSANRNKEMVAGLVSEAAKLKTDISALEENLSATRQTLGEKNAELEQLQQHIHMQVEIHALERGQLVERSGVIQKLYEELKTDSSKLQSTIEETSTQLRIQDKELSQLATEKSLKENETQKLREEIASLLQKLSESSNQHASEKDRLLAELKSAKQEITVSQEQCESLSRKYKSDKTTMLADLAKANEETKSVIKKLSETSSKIKSLQATFDSRTKQNNATIEALQKENKQLKNEVAKRFKEISVLTNLIEATTTEQNTKAKPRPRNTTKTLASKSTRGMRHKVMKYLESRKHIKLLRQSGLFDPKWYIEAYPDLASSKKASRNPVWHYVKFGGAEGRNPSEEFVTSWYLAQNADVAAEGINPLVHYILYGNDEGRLPKPPTGQPWL